VKNNLGVLYVLGGHLTAARGLFQSSLAILHKSHAASHPLLVSVRANLEQVEAHLVDDAATGPGTIDVRQLKRYFHGQHFYYSPFGDTKREEKMQKAEEAQAQQEQGDKKKPIPPEWQKLFAQANIDVAALSYEKAQALIAALKKKLTDPSPVGGAAKQDTDRSRLTQSALVPHSTGDSDQGRADLLRSQPARMRLAPIKPIAPIAPIAPITCAPADPSAYYASADHDDDDPYGYAGGPPPTPIAPPAQPTGTAYYADSDDFYGADIDGGVPLGDAMHEGYAGAAVDANMAASVYAYAEGAPVSSDDAAAATSQSLSLVMSARRTAAATASGSDDDDEGWADEPFQPMILLEQASLITGGGGGEQQPDDPTAMAAMELEEENAIRHALALEKEPSAEELASRQRLEEVTRNLAGVREIAGQVVEDMVNRADSLANIEARTEELTLQAERFRRGSKELHQRPSLLSRLPSISSVFSRFLGTTRQASESVRTNLITLPLDHPLTSYVCHVRCVRVSCVSPVRYSRDITTRSTMSTTCCRERRCRIKRSLRPNSPTTVRGRRRAPHTPPRATQPISRMTTSPRTRWCSRTRRRRRRRRLRKWKKRRKRKGSRRRRRRRRRRKRRR
jgi:hypothetical protein